MKQDVKDETFIMEFPEEKTSIYTSFFQKNTVYLLWC